MKRSNRILLSLFAAAVTFGSLYAFTGRPPGFDQRGYPHNREGCVEGRTKNPPIMRNDLPATKHLPMLQRTKISRSIS